MIFTCNEPGGPVQRYVRPMERGDWPRVWQNLQVTHLAKGRDLPYEMALQEFIRPDKCYWVVDNVGLLMASMAGDVHAFFWDRRLRGRENLCKYMCLVVMEIYNRDDVWIPVSQNERTVLAFAKRIGFVEESLIGEVFTLRLTKEVARG